MLVTWPACISTIRPRFIPPPASAAAEEAHLWSLPPVQPPPAPWCGDAGPAPTCRAGGARPKGKPLPDALSSSRRPWRADALLVFDCGWKVYIYRHGRDRGKPSLLVFTAEPRWPASQLTSVWWGACSEQINRLCLWCSLEQTDPRAPVGLASSYVTPLVLSWCIDTFFYFNWSLFIFQHGTTDEVTSEEEEEEEMGEVRAFPRAQISQCVVFRLYGFQNYMWRNEGLKYILLDVSLSKSLFSISFNLVHVFLVVFFHLSSTPTLFFKLYSDKILSRVLSKHRSHWAWLPA